MISKKVKDIVNSYLQTPVVEEDFVSIEDLDEDLLEDLDDDIDIDFIIDDIANFYNEADEETQAVIDEMLEEEDGIENIVSVIYEEEEDEEEDDEDDEEDEEERANEKRAIDRKLKKRTANEEVEDLTELKKSTLASYIKKAAPNIRTQVSLQRSFERDAEAELATVVNNSPYNVNNKPKDPIALGTAQRNLDAIEGLAKDFKRKAQNRVDGIGRAVVKLSKAKAPKSKNPGPTIDQPSKLGLAKTKISAAKITDPKASAPGHAIDQPSKTGNEKPTVSTKKTTKH